MNDHIERTKRMIEVMQAYVDGAIIENHKGPTVTPRWNWGLVQYTVSGGLPEKKAL